MKAKTSNKQSSVYLAPESRRFLKDLKTGQIPSDEACYDGEKKKETLQLSAITVRVLELLQRASTDKGDKKSKGWFIDQALQSYVASKDAQFFQELKNDQQTKGKKKSKSWFVEEALKAAYKETYSLTTAVTIE